MGQERTKSALPRVDLFSGFLGAGKTTLLKKLIPEAWPGERLAVIENEFGKVPIDTDFLEETGVRVRALAAGCICCTLQGDFRLALRQVAQEQAPDRILIEASGAAALSSVISVLESVEEIVLDAVVTVVDATRCVLFVDKLGNFYRDQIVNAGTLILSRTQSCTEEALAATVSRLRELNAEAEILTAPWDSLSTRELREALQRQTHVSAAPGLTGRLRPTIRSAGGLESCAVKTERSFTPAELREVLEALLADEGYGRVFRAKGVLRGSDSILFFDALPPNEINIRAGHSAQPGQLVVHGTALQEERLIELFKQKTKRGVF